MPRRDWRLPRPGVTASQVQAKGVTLYSVCEEARVGRCITLNVPTAQRELFSPCGSDFGARRPAVIFPHRIVQVIGCLWLVTAPRSAVKEP